MTYVYPWNEFKHIKFNDNELLNHITFNIHVKKLYDNLYYLNSRPVINIASSITSGVVKSTETSSELLSSTTVKSVTPSAFIEVINSINQKTNYDSASATYITDTFKFIRGEFTTTSGETSSYIQEVDLGENTFSSSINAFVICPETTSIITSTVDNDMLCYKYDKDTDDIFDYSEISAIVEPGIINPLRYVYIVYNNEFNDITKIKWTAFGS